MNTPLAVPSYILQLQLLEESRLSSSSATWAILEIKNWLTSITKIHVLNMHSSEIEASSCQCTMTTYPVNKLILKPSLPTNEGHAHSSM